MKIARRWKQTYMRYNRQITNRKIEIGNMKQIWTFTQWRKLKRKYIIKKEEKKTRKELKSACKNHRRKHCLRGKCKRKKTWSMIFY